MMLSEAIPKLMHKVMKHSGSIQNGFLKFNNRTIMVATFDEEACVKFLEGMVIKPQNVLTYLRRKYIPTYNDKGAIFKDQACIQKVIVKEDKSLYIHIAKSEPHKIITDTMHIMQLLDVKGIEHTMEVKYYIECVQIAYQDSLLYVDVLKDNGLKPPSVALRYARELLKKYGKLENIARIKKRSVKRKFLRWLVKNEKLTWVELRKCINITDFSESNIRAVCNEIREAARERGVEVDF